VLFGLVVLAGLVWCVSPVHVGDVYCGSALVAAHDDPGPQLASAGVQQLLDHRCGIEARDRVAVGVGLASVGLISLVITLLVMPRQLVTAPPLMGPPGRLLPRRSDRHPSADLDADPSKGPSAESQPRSWLTETDAGADIEDKPET
jgi:hypothetical protein